MKNICLSAQNGHSQDALGVFVKIACIGGQRGAHSENVGTITERLRIHMIRPTRESHQEPGGVTGISRESRHTGAEEEITTQYIIAHIS